MTTENWRTAPEDAETFLRHQQKRIALEQRRPVIRRPADLVGPGIGASAVRITDFNDILATYDGYYASAIGALGAPNATEPFVGIVVMDDLLGGYQLFTGLVSGNEYKRLFLRNPSDERSISFGLWKSSAPPTFTPEMGYAERTTNFTTTNTALYSTAAASVITALSVSVTGEGKAVEVSFDANILHSVVNTNVDVYLIVNGGTSVQPGGALAFTGPFAVASQNRYVRLSRRVVLTSGGAYTFTVGVSASASGTTTVTGSTQYPASLRVNRLA